ncbi:Nucleotide-binding universal stress protein, UspA family [Streptosporangium canum]|uniref:Nucleotide-binding universal stress protein, UspA family n=1 Tax=Streptosporangium canum TaxID=324952 RepID=A0A1I3V0X8_9ACTN|nr:universal stress protein [Streptosporangium canum]SFJ88810.1 Nucleotide-binding universal stress protein, UspA family [Streptosporangium canum]
MRREIVVGFDGSPQSRTAVEWAARECRTRRTELTVCHVWDGPHAEREAAITGQVRRLAGRTLIEGVELAERLLPGRSVRSIMARGNPGPELASLSRAAEMLVVGCRGLGGVAGLLLGSVSAHVATHALCPVLAVRPADPASPPSPGNIVVGVDGSACSAAALRFALGHARLHRLPVHVIHARKDTWPQPGWEVERWLAEAVASLSGDHSGVAVTAGAVSQLPLPALLARSRQARLLVVGSRGLGRVRARVLGSVSQELLHRASCPVAVVKQHD